MNKFLVTHIPNWKRFCEIYNPKNDFIRAFNERIESIEDEELRSIVWKKINVNLWILLLAHKEIDEWVFEEIFDSIQENKEI